MFAFIARLFKSPQKICTIESHWCRTPITLDPKVTAALGGKVTAVTAMVDIDFVLEAQEVRVQNVRLSRANPNIAAVNRRETGHAKSICSDDELKQALAGDLADRNGFLWKAMTTRWHKTYGKPPAARRPPARSQQAD